MDELVAQIGQICFNEPLYATRGEFHERTITLIKDYLESIGFTCTREKPLIFDHTIWHGEGAEEKRGGRLDLFAQDKDRKIAIEVDTGASLKNKSTEKLFQSGCDILIGIARGRAQWDNQRLLEKNLKRMREISAASHGTIFLILARNRVYSRVPAAGSEG